MNSINEQLKALYCKYWEVYRDHILNAVEAASPFLIYASDRYVNAEKKVLFCGQETLGWEDGIHQKGTTVEGLMKVYDDFVNNGSYRSPYWNFQRRLMKANPNLGFVQNNIVKIGRRAARGCDDNIDELAKMYFPVFKDELDILRPDFIIFMTGPYYDRRIQAALGDFEKIKIGDDENCFDKLVFKDSSIPPSIRINHPGWLQRNNLYRLMACRVDQILKTL